MRTLLILLCLIASIAQLPAHETVANSRIVSDTEIAEYRAAYEARFPQSRIKKLVDIDTFFLVTMIAIPILLLIGGTMLYYSTIIAPRKRLERRKLYRRAIESFNSGERDATLWEIAYGNAYGDEHRLKRIYLHLLCQRGFSDTERPEVPKLKPRVPMQRAVRRKSRLKSPQSTTVHEDGRSIRITPKKQTKKRGETNENTETNGMRRVIADGHHSNRRRQR